MGTIKKYVNREPCTPIPKEPEVKRTPVRVDKRTTILVKDGCDIEAHIKKFREREVAAPGFMPWD